MSSQSTNKVVIMEKPSGAQSDHPLKCPRCDSCNTKFCYYNNYSLSQPRHFCKACKRYWTRGGTLRNVPVGGGCRKNKRVVKRATPPSNCGGDGISSAATTTIRPSVQQPDHTDLTNHLFYTNPLELNFPFSGFNTTRVSSKTVGFDHQAQMINGLGVRFSSGLMVSENYENGFKQIQDVSITTTTSSSSLFSDNINPILFGSSTNFAPLSTMSSLLASSLGLKDINESPGLMPYEDMQIPDENGVIIGKETKIGGENGFGLNPTQIEQMNSTDHSSLVWTTTNGGAWFDPSNMGSSVPSLI